MGSLSIWHWLIVLVIILLVFGTKKLSSIGKDLGSAVRGFKEGVKGEETENATAGKQAESPPQPPSESGKQIDKKSD